MMPRVVLPELLDVLSATDPRAIKSRKDLRRLNRLMGDLAAVRSALDSVIERQSSIHLVELGGGDGNLLADLARQRSGQWPALAATLVDLQPVVAAPTKVAIDSSGWMFDTVKADVFDWLDSPPRSREIVIANLFVHHFENAPLAKLLAAIAARATAFVCVEPRRSQFALLGSHCVGAIGCNDVTRHDAVASVHAGFRGDEISALWPTSDDWVTEESRVGLFLHRFVARRAIGK